MSLKHVTKKTRKNYSYQPKVNVNGYSGRTMKRRSIFLRRPYKVLEFNFEAVLDYRDLLGITHMTEALLVLIGYASA